MSEIERPRGNVSTFAESGLGFPSEGGDWSRCSHGNQFQKIMVFGATPQEAFERWRDAFMATMDLDGPNTVCWRKAPEIERGRLSLRLLRSWKVASRHCVCCK